MVKEIEKEEKKPVVDSLYTTPTNKAASRQSSSYYATLPRSLPSINYCGSNLHEKSHTKYQESQDQSYCMYLASLE